MSAGRLDGRTALITGAGSGIGRAAALLFAREGASVAVADLAPEGGRETAEMVNDAGGPCGKRKRTYARARRMRAGL